MAKMNQLQDPNKTAQIMREFEKQNMKMGMTDELINETLDGVLEGSDDESASDAIVNQVLDEIGIEISGKVCLNFQNNYFWINHLFSSLIKLVNAPTPAKGSLASKSTADEEDISDADIQNMLSKLKA